LYIWHRGRKSIYIAIWLKNNRIMDFQQSTKYTNVLKTITYVMSSFVIQCVYVEVSFMFCFSVTSSEKVDKENRYGEFCIVCAPYPGKI